MCSQLEKQPARFKNVNCRITIRPGSSPAKYKLQRNENIHSLKNLCMGIHSNFIHNRQMQKQHKCSSTDEGINVYSVSQLCPTLCNPIDASLPGSSIHGIVQARILEWDAIPSSRGSSLPGIKPRVSNIADSLPAEPPGKLHIPDQFMEFTLASTYWIWN